VDWKSLSNLFTDTYQAYGRHRVQRMGAALAYYTAFSLAPAIILILSLASLAVKKDFAEREILLKLNEWVGHTGATAVEDVLDHTSSPSALSWRTVISFGILLVSASGAFAELHDSLHQIWEVPDPQNPIRHLVRERLLSFAMIFILGFFILVSLVLSIVFMGVSHLMAINLSPLWLEFMNNSLSTIVIAALFGVIFRLLPSVELTWRDVLPGAFLSSFLFALGKFLLGWYLSRSTISSSFGAAGSLLIVLVWVFYSAQILLIGAEFTRSYTLRFGSMVGVTPGSNPL
jgi:membrane protein